MTLVAADHMLGTAANVSHTLTFRLLAALNVTNISSKPGNSELSTKMQSHQVAVGTG